MAMLSFEKNGLTQYASNTEVVLELIKDGFESDYFGNVQIMDYINNGFSFEFYSQALQDEILYSEIPEYLKGVEDYNKFKELYDLDQDMVKRLLDHGLSIDDIKEMDDINQIDEIGELISMGFTGSGALELIESGYNADSVPEFLINDIKRLGVDDVIEWIEWIEKERRSDSESIACAAYHLDIEPSKINDCYEGQFWDVGDYAKQHVEDYYGLDTIPDYARNHIDWESLGKDLMCDLNEYDDHYFNNNY